MVVCPPSAVSVSADQFPHYDYEPESCLTFKSVKINSLLSYESTSHNLRWVHKSSYCEWEWTGGGVKQLGCSLDQGPPAPAIARSVGCLK